MGIMLRPCAAHAALRVTRWSALTEVSAHRRTPAATERHSSSAQAAPIR